MGLDALEDTSTVRCALSDDFDAAALISPVGSNRDVDVCANSYENISLISPSHLLACTAMSR